MKLCAQNGNFFSALLGTTGARLLIDGDLRGQALLILSLKSALNLVDLLLEEPLGTAVQLRADPFERGFGPIVCRKVVSYSQS